MIAATSLAAATPRFAASATATVRELVGGIVPGLS
jgi:hypothetical protein